MAASMPVITAPGTNSAITPPRVAANSNCITPARHTANKKASKLGRLVMAARTMVVKPAAGPATDSGDRLIAPTTMPPTMPATMPDISGAPDASATPRHKGNATSATTTEAGTSCRQLARMPTFSLMRFVP